MVERLLPSYGNRHNVFLAVVTTAAFQVLIESEVPIDYADTLVADMGWKIYYWMLKVISFPFRLTIRDPVGRMEKAIAVLMKFSFSASAAPGYEVKVWTEGNIKPIHTGHTALHRL